MNGRQEHSAEKDASRSRGPELRSVAKSIESTFPCAAALLRGIARELDDARRPASADSDAPAMREEWAVRHSQGIYAGEYGRPLTEQRARQWAEDDRAQDSRRQFSYRGKTVLLRRLVTEWEEVPTRILPPEVSDQ